jgi:predicted transglutaminase-like cysteine proteinase
VRRAINTVLAAVTITVTAMAVHHDASATLPAFPLQPVAFVYLQQLKSAGDGPPAAAYGYLAQPMAFSYSPLLKSYLDPSQLALFVGVGPSNRSLEPLRRVSLGLSEKLTSVVPARQKDRAPERVTSLAPARHTALTPERQLMSPIVRIQFNTSVLAPMAHTFFCLKYRNECKVHKIVFRGGAATLTAKRWAELVRVNAAVNRAIISQPNTEGLAGEKWLISPKFGECHDYAVTKRHELLALGWPARELLLSEVVTSWGEHHLVLVVRTSDGDFVLDNLNRNIRSWSKTPYEWVRVQSPGNPTFWSTVARTTVWAKVSGLAKHES